jgi:hypothetical protein
MGKARVPVPRNNATIIHVKDPLCAQTDPEIFFPSDRTTGGAGWASAKPAKVICAQCSYTIQCLLTALSNKEEYGIWGGATARERKAIKTKTQAIEFTKRLKQVPPK